MSDDNNEQFKPLQDIIDAALVSAARDGFAAFKNKDELNERTKDLRQQFVSRHSKELLQRVQAGEVLSIEEQARAAHPGQTLRDIAKGNLEYFLFGVITKNRRVRLIANPKFWIFGENFNETWKAAYYWQDAFFRDNICNSFDHHMMPNDDPLKNKQMTLYYIETCARIAYCIDI